MNAGRIAAGKLSQQPVDLGLCALAVFRSRKRHGSLEAAALQVCDDGDLRGGIRHVQLEAQLMLLGQHGRIVLEAQDLVGRVGPAQLEIPGRTDLARKQESGVARSEERRLGKESGSTCRTWW